MSERNDLPQLMREYRDDLRSTAPPREVEDRLKAALRQQRGRRSVIPFPRALAAAAALVIVGAVAWYGPRQDRGVTVATKPVKQAQAEHQAEPVLMAEAKPPTPAPKSRPRLTTGPVVPPVPDQRLSPVVSTSPTRVAPPSGSGLSRETDERRFARPLTSGQEPSEALESKANTAPPALDAAAPVRRVAVFYKVRKEVRVPGQTPVVTFAAPAAPAVLGFTAAPVSTRAKAARLDAVPGVVSLGERAILGHLCTGSKSTLNGTSVERWYSKELGLDLLLKTITPDGIETIEEITEVVRRP